MFQLPQVLLTYIQGLKAHDVAKIGETLADEVEIILPGRSLKKKAFLAYLTALYAAFPDWRYHDDEPETSADGGVSIRWRQGGTHTEKWILPGFAAVAPTGTVIQIPYQFFYYRLTGDKIIAIRPEPISGGIPQAIFDQIGVTASML